MSEPTRNAKEKSISPLESTGAEHGSERRKESSNTVRAVVELELSPTGMGEEEEVIAEAVACLENVLQLNEDRSFNRIEEENRVAKENDIQISGGFEFSTDLLNHVEIGGVNHLKEKKVGEAYVERGEFNREKRRFEQEGNFPVYEVGGKKIVVLE